MPGDVDPIGCPKFSMYATRTVLLKRGCFALHTERRTTVAVINNGKEPSLSIWDVCPFVRAFDHCLDGFYVDVIAQEVARRERFPFFDLCNCHV